MDTFVQIDLFAVIRVGINRICDLEASLAMDRHNYNKRKRGKNQKLNLEISIVTKKKTIDLRTYKLVLLLVEMHTAC